MIFKLLPILLASLIVFFPLFTFAAGCAGPQKLTITDLANIQNFAPVIPESCQGAIGFDSLPGILVRGYGLLTSIVVQLALVTLFIVGFLWILSGVDQSQTAKYKRLFSNMVWALIMVFGAYIIVNTVVSAIGGSGINTSLDGIFEFNIN
jgi:hypothetical protein